MLLMCCLISFLCRMKRLFWSVQTLHGMLPLLSLLHCSYANRNLSLLSLAHWHYIFSTALSEMVVIYRWNDFLSHLNFENKLGNLSSVCMGLLRNLLMYLVAWPVMSYHYSVGRDEVAISGLDSSVVYLVSWLFSLHTYPFCSGMEAFSVWCPEHFLVSSGEV